MSASTTSSEVPGRKLIPWICLALLVACRRSPQPVLAFVAVSAAAAIERAAKSLEVPLVVDANASSLLAQQIVRGAKPEIGLPIKPIFETRNPTFTILDLAWAPR